jgi:hypothetical protein
VNEDANIAVSQLKVVVVSLAICERHRWPVQVSPPKTADPYLELFHVALLQGATSNARNGTRRPFDGNRSKTARGCKKKIGEPRQEPTKKVLTFPPVFDQRCQHSAYARF